MKLYSSTQIGVLYNERLENLIDLGGMPTTVSLYNIWLVSDSDEQ